MDGSSDPLCGDTGFTMGNSITGAEFGAMTDVDIAVDGYLVGSEVSGSSLNIWNELGQ